ncbi:hypothetical protein [Mucilaginibacter flavidus]|uniref:hypothetical protein n=1 Tax=Mucilaginibacter flavidus TaxID=2949309 RepID=UPI0020922E24|nr:hypothetical protein [Mucilaginibacter flavidus]MCO5950433.1 hypothetical protein [Mucilaginibacter flavidus]
MHIKLNTWQTFALFLPFIAGFALLNIPNPAKDNFQTNFAVANFLSVLGLTIIISYQALLVLGFIRWCGIKSTLFKWNTLIPLSFFVLYLLYVIYFTFINPEYYNHQYNLGPLRKAGFRASGWVILFFLIHAFITFYFINNQIVAREINGVTNADEQDQLKDHFLLPMKRLTKASVWLIAAFIFLTTVMDIIKVKNGH